MAESSSEKRDNADFQQQPGYIHPAPPPDYGESDAYTKQQTSSYPEQQPTSYSGQESSRYPGPEVTQYPGQQTTSHPEQKASPYPGQPAASYPGQPTASYPGQPAASYPGQQAHSSSQPNIYPGQQPAPYAYDQQGPYPQKAAGAYAGAQPAPYPGAQPVQPAYQVVQRAPLTNEYANPYLAWSVLSCLLCCWILGIIAIVMSSLTMQENSRGDGEKARSYSRSALGLNVASTMIGVICYIVVIALSV